MNRTEALIIVTLFASMFAFADGAIVGVVEKRVNPGGTTAPYDGFAASAFTTDTQLNSGSLAQSWVSYALGVQATAGEKISALDVSITTPMTSTTGFHQRWTYDEDLETYIATPSSTNVTNGDSHLVVGGSIVSETPTENRNTSGGPARATGAEYGIGTSLSGAWGYNASEQSSQSGTQRFAYLTIPRGSETAVTITANVAANDSSGNPIPGSSPSFIGFGPPPPSVAWDGSTLGLTFGSEGDRVRFGISGDGYIQYRNEQQGSEPWTKTPALNGQPTRINLYLAGGNDFLLDSTLTTPPTLYVEGGEGNDDIKLPTGLGLAIAKGGNGNDTINGEHHQHNAIYGEAGTDDLYGGSDGWNFLHGGSDGASMRGFAQAVNPPYDQPTIYWLETGAINSVIDGVNTDSYYVLSADSPSEPGTLTVIESNGGDDRFYTAGHDFDVTGTTIVSDVLEGTFSGWSGIEDVIQDAGDWNADGAVNATDYVLWRKLFWPLDYSLWRDNFGANPEPRSAVLLVIGLAILAANWRKR